MKRESITSKQLLLPFILVTSLFFFWGFVHNLDPILIPHLRKTFQLNDLQSSLVDSAVFVAYFVMAIPAGFIMRRNGYRMGIVIGLLLFSIGCFLFIPAANTRQYVFFLGALFVIASGLTFLETAANPYAALLGPSTTSSERLNFAQSFNGLAVVVAPIFGGTFILSGKELSPAEYNALSPEALNNYLQQEADSVKMPYLLLGIIVLVVAVLFMLFKLPDVKDSTDEGNTNPFYTLKHRHLRWAVIAQFFYVGAQVCVASFFIRMCTSVAGFDEKTAANWLGWGYGLSFMAGRFIGTACMRFTTPQKLLAVFAICSIVLSACAILLHGKIIVYSLVGVSFFMSIMFPTIFSLGIKDLGTDTKLGSSMIVMAIVGGALLPPLLGIISDTTGNIQNGYIVPLLCYIVVLLFAINGYKIKQHEKAVTLH